MLPLRRQAAVLGLDGPAVAHFADLAAAGIDHRDIEIDHVAVLENLVTWYAMANHVVDRGANRLRIWRIARRAVVEWGRDGPLHVDHILMAKPVQFTGGDAGLHEWRDVVKHLGAQSTGDSHALDIVIGFY